ncbi:two-component system response regulator CreB [Marinicellulosiphila megalodicopiae]|uniref:two-component system response regulator CreB n=1 Tax=Marinicellulosiphila megalodicopiae TaxID=2724896 RepID=UPI003BB061F2
MQPTILIVDDEPSISQTLVYALQLEGFNSVTCELGGQALEILKNQSIDFIVLDVGLPDINGFELCKTIREFSTTPILFLTARNDEFDRILGLEIGADDYVCKPFSPREVSTRIKVILKRLNTTSKKEPETTAHNALLELDSNTMSAMFYSKPLSLTKLEFQILAVLFKRPEQVYSRAQLMDIIWPNSASLERSVDTHIKSLRTKLKSINCDHDIIKTHRGIGYSLIL